jgi:hypothetical protein
MTFTIVGVMPPGFDYPERSTMFWTVLAPRPGPGTNVFGNVVAQLQNNVSLSTATDEANAIGAALRVKPLAIGFGASAPPPLPATAIGVRRSKDWPSSRTPFDAVRFWSSSCQHVRNRSARPQ